MRVRLAAAAVLAMALAARAAAAAEPGVEEVRLENGLTVLLRRIAGAQDVALVTLFSIGEEHDPADGCGTAHLLEHLYVTAAAGTLPARTAEELVRSHPRGWNAQTGWDYTVVATVFPKADLDRELAEAAARMGSLRIEPADLAREVPRVLEELEVMYGSALGAVNHAANAASERTDRPQGGDAARIPGIALETLRARWSRFYKPANATVALAGAVDPATREAVAKAFGALPRGEPVPAPPFRAVAAGPAATPVSTEARTVTTSRATRFAVAISVPVGRLDRSPAWLVVAARLSAGTSPPAPPNAPVRPKPPVGVQLAFTPIDRPESLTLFGPLRDDETPEQALGRLEKALASAAAPPVGAEDRANARRVFAFLLGLAPLPDAVLLQNPYGVAFGVARRAQMRLDPAALSAALEAVRDPDLQSLDLRAARVVARPAR